MGPFEVLIIFLAYGSPLFMLGVTYFIGSSIERNHYEDIQRRENASRAFPVLNLKTVPESWEVTESDLVTANVVISVDYFKRFLAGLRAIVGGRVTSYEPLMDRARREAVLRLKETAHSRGFHGVINLRLMSADIASSQNNKGLAGVEIMAFGTAIRRAR